MRDFSLRQYDHDVIDIYRRLTESACKHDLDAMHDNYMHAIATYNHSILDKFSDGAIQFLKDTLEVLQRWGSETLLWLLPFGESFNARN